MILSDALILPV